MMISLLLLFHSPSAALPQPFTETHMHDIGCVATLGLVADEQRRGISSSSRFPDVRERGSKLAGIVGMRVMQETGQSKEVVAGAITQAVNDQQRLSIETADATVREKILDELVAKCLPLLDREVPTG